MNGSVERVKELRTVRPVSCVMLAGDGFSQGGWTFLDLVVLVLVSVMVMRRGGL